jgi:hypothetical protein
MGVSDQLHAPATLLQVPTEYEVGLTPEAVWTLQRIEKSLTPAGNPTQAVQPVARGCTVGDYSYD